MVEDVVYTQKYRKKRHKLPESLLFCDSYKDFSRVRKRIFYRVENRNEHVPFFFGAFVLDMLYKLTFVVEIDVVTDYRNEEKCRDADEEGNEKYEAVGRDLAQKRDGDVSVFAVDFANTVKNKAAHRETDVHQGVEHRETESRSVRFRVSFECDRNDGAHECDRDRLRNEAEKRDDPEIGREEQKKPRKYCQNRADKKDFLDAYRVNQRTYSENKERIG